MDTRLRGYDGCCAHQALSRSLNTNGGPFSLPRTTSLCYIEGSLTEGSHSGLVRAPAKRLGGENLSRGFESHSLRHSSRPPHKVDMEDYYIWTIGCQMNVADSERLESALEQMGLGKAATAKEADVVVLNSCVVRQSAENKVVGMLGHLKPMKRQDGDKVVALMGCMVGPKTDTLQQRFPQVDVFMRPQQFTPLIDLLGDRMGIDPEGLRWTAHREAERDGVRADHSRLRQVLHLLHHSVSPWTRSQPHDSRHRSRGRASRRPGASARSRCSGQNVDSYGHDLDGNVDLGHLLKAVHPIGGIDRIRFLTSHPNDMSDHIIGHGW